MNSRLKRDLLALVRTYLKGGAGGSGLPLKTMLTDLERMVIERALESTHGYSKAAAHILGLQESTLCEKIKRLEIVRKKPGDGKGAPTPDGTRLARPHLAPIVGTPPI
jgi:hypothetical protein